MAIVEVDPGESIQDAVDANPAGTQYYLTAGTHRQQVVAPKVGDEFYGESTDGTFVTGARDITSGWVTDGGNWKKTGATWGTFRSSGNCLAGYRCGCTEDLYFDNVLLQHVTSYADPLGAGKWFFDYDNDVIYVGDNPAGATLIEQCDKEVSFNANVADVTLHDMTIEKYASRLQYGGVGTASGAPIGSGWTMQNLLVRFCHGIGVRIGPAITVTDCAILYNGQMGIGGTGDGGLFKDSELGWNNTAGIDGWENGGSKFTQTDGFTIRNIYSHDNIGPGLWADINNINFVYEDCLIADNTGEAIRHEISYDAIIRNNTILRNGVGNAGWYDNSAVLNYCSPNVQVYGNLLVFNGGEIMGAQQDTSALGPPTYTHGDLIISNFDVHDNWIHHKTNNGFHGGCGIVKDYGDQDVWTTLNNRFYNNRYRFADSDTHFAWLGAERSTAAWKGYGHDLATESLTVLI